MEWNVFAECFVCHVWNDSTIVIVAVMAKERCPLLIRPSSYRAFFMISCVGVAIAHLFIVMS